MLTLATRKRILVLLTFVVLSFTFFANTNAVYANEEKKAKANDFKIGHLFLDFGGLNDIIEDSGFNYLRGIELCYRKILNKDYLNASIIYAWERNKGIGLHLYGVGAFLEKNIHSFTNSYVTIGSSMGLGEFMITVSKTEEKVIGKTQDLTREFIFHQNKLRKNILFIKPELAWRDKNNLYFFSISYLLSYDIFGDEWKIVGSGGQKVYGLLNNSKGITLSAGFTF